MAEKMVHGIYDDVELRRRAEERLGADMWKTHTLGTLKDPLRLIHELEVYQIELEMQNAALQQARDEVESMLEKYTDLYDFAPIGYFSLDRKGIIRAANLTGAAFIGIERSRLNGRRLAQFVADTDLAAFTAFLANVFTNRVKESCEVLLQFDGNPSRFVQIEALGVASVEECRIALIDITERKRLEELLRREAQNRSVTGDQTPLTSGNKEHIILRRKITKREREVLLMVGQGVTSREIAERLGVCLKTVEVHRANLMKKLDASNAVKLARWAVILEQMLIGAE